MKFKSLLWLLPVVLMMASCTQTLEQKYAKDRYAEPADQSQTDQNIIIDYLVANDIDAERTESGIYYKIDEPGEGGNPAADNIVKVHYKGYNTNGKTFDSSYDRGEPAEFSLQGVVAGWKEGIPLFQKGGKGSLFIPSGLAYGPRAMGEDIPANSVLIFDVELLDFSTQEEFRKKKEAEAAEKAKIQGPKDEAAIKKYVEDNKLKMERTEDGIYYSLEKAGGKEKPTLDNKVTVHYKGTLFDGSEFDSSYKRGQPATFPLRGVVPGWQKAIPLLGKGGKGKFIIPSVLAYGERGTPGIPPNSSLIFEVELLDIE